MIVAEWPAKADTQWKPARFPRPPRAEAGPPHRTGLTAARSVEG